MSLSIIRSWIRRVGESVRYVSPIGGKAPDSRAEAILSHASRLSVHEAYTVGALSDRVAITSGAAVTSTIPAGSGRFVRVLCGVDVWVRVEQPAHVADALDPFTDNVSVFIPYGETNFLVIPDTAQDYVMSIIGVAASGDFYWNVVS